MLLSCVMLCSVLTFAGLEFALVTRYVLCIRPSSFPTKVAIENSSLLDTLLGDGCFSLLPLHHLNVVYLLIEVLTLPLFPREYTIVFIPSKSQS